MKQTKLNNRLTLYTNNNNTKTYIVDRVNFNIKTTTSNSNNSYTLALVLLNLLKMTVVTNRVSVNIGQVNLDLEVTKAS